MRSSPTRSAVPPRAPSVGSLALLLLASPIPSGCSSAERAELAVVLQGIDLDPAAVGDIRLRVVDAEDGALQGEGATTGAALGDVPALFRASDLEPGRRVRILVDGDVGEPCTARGRAVGRSPSFVFRGDDQTLVVPFACAEQFVRPREPPATDRIGHALVPIPGQGALLVGGAGRLDLGAMAPDSQVDDLVSLVERYVPEDGAFAAAGDLIAPRTAPGVAPLGSTAQEDGRDDDGPSPETAVAVVGGTVEVAPGCLDDVERFAPATGQSRAGTPLPFARCAPTAGLVPATGEILVAGGRRVPADPAFLLLPPDLSGEPRIPAGAAGVARRSPRVVTLADGATALVLGGVSPTEANPSPPVAERVRVRGCPDGSDPCVDVVPFEDGPNRGLVEMDATYVPCLESGARGGAVYVSGGRTGPPGSTRTLDQLWCARDDPDGDAAQMLFRPAGRLDRPRTGHAAAFLAEPRPRLLVVGGSSRTEPAALLAVDGCTCAPATPLDADPPIVLPWAGDPTGARSATLDDGSVLVVGGLRRPAGDLVFEGTGEAALWFPDLPPVDRR